MIRLIGGNLYRGFFWVGGLYGEISNLYLNLYVLYVDCEWSFFKGILRLGVG